MTEYEYSECAECPGACCGSCHIYVSHEEMEAIATHLGVTIQEVIDWATVPAAEANNFHFLRPCRFLRQGLCSVYPARPGACRLYRPVERTTGDSCQEWHLKVLRDAAVWEEQGRNSELQKKINKLRGEK